MSKAKDGMNVREPFPRRRVAQARGVPGVEAAYVLHIELDQGTWKNRESHSSRPIRILAYDPDEPVLLFPEVVAQLGVLRLADTVLLDEESKDFYGRREAGIVTELARRSVHVGGTFRLGPDFLSDGNVIMSEKNYLKYFHDPRDPGAVRERAELGLIRTTAGADRRAVQERLSATLPDDVVVLDHDQLIEWEREYWCRQTPLDYIFGLGALLGFVVGVIICYQILFTDILDHLPQFATLKAIGYPDAYLVRVVLEEAVLLALLGFVPGLVLSLGLYRVAAYLTGLPMQLTPGRAVLVLALAIGMSIVSGLLAVHKALMADPAEVFG
jgi:putative ABC transport system permease protein